MHAFVSEPRLVRQGLANYWGYNTLGFFAPHAALRARAAGPQGVLREFKGMVELLHEAGIEVMLDVVYNHTCRGGPPTARRCRCAGWTTAPTTGWTAAAATST